MKTDVANLSSFIVVHRQSSSFSVTLYLSPWTIEICNWKRKKVIDRGELWALKRQFETVASFWSASVRVWRRTGLSVLCALVDKSRVECDNRARRSPRHVWRQQINAIYSASASFDCKLVQIHSRTRRCHLRAINLHIITINFISFWRRLFSVWSRKNYKVCNM